MRKIKRIKIDDLEITVKELRVKDVFTLLEKVNTDKKDFDFSSIKTLLEDAMPLACDIDIEKLRDMAPSEIKEIVDTFKEVNAVFFDGARAAGLGSVIEELKKSMKQDFGKIFADSLKQGTETQPITGSDIL